MISRWYCFSWVFYSGYYYLNCDYSCSSKYSGSDDLLDYFELFELSDLFDFLLELRDLIFWLLSYKVKKSYSDDEDYKGDFFTFISSLLMKEEAGISVISPLIILLFIVFILI